MESKAFRIFQVSDIHLFANHDDKLLQLNTFKSFYAVLNHLLASIIEQKPDLIVLSGDLSQDCSLESYQYILDSLKNIQCEIAWIPGNHDASATMQSVFTQSYLSSNRHIITDDWQIILLDSHQDGKVPGFLSDDEFDFLNRSLQTCNKFALIMLHHHVLPVGSAWLDKLNLLNSDEFLRMIDRFTQVKGVVSGHVHQASEQKRNDVLYITSPSTCVQFKPLSNNFAVDKLMPGFNVIDLFPDGHIQATSMRIPYDPAFLPDLNSTGY